MRRLGFPTIEGTRGIRVRGQPGQNAGDSCKEGRLEAYRMPVYVYQCKVCGSEQELLHGIMDKPKCRLLCDKCGKSTPVVRLITTVGGGVTGKSKPPSL